MFIYIALIALLLLSMILFGFHIVSANSVVIIIAICLFILIAHDVVTSIKRLKSK